MPADQRRIGNGKDGRSVDEHEIITGRHLREESLEPRTADQLGGVRRDLPGSDEVEVRLRGLSGSVGDRHLAADDLRHAPGAMTPEVLVEMPAAQIAVDEQDALTGGGEDVSEVDGQERLADARARSAH